MIRITGDTHGERARFCVLPGESGWGAEDHLIVCGDFGYIFRDDEEERLFLDELAQKPYTILFVDGNHENFAALNALPVEDWNGGKVHRVRGNVLHLMRGQVFTIEGSTFFTMGGAYSIDRYLRKKGESYWEEELPCGEEYREAGKNLALHGMRVDYILTHTLPREAIRRIGITPDGHDDELTGFLEYVMYEAEFRHWYCGHWHRDVDLELKPGEGPKLSILWYDVREIGERPDETGDFEQ